jgi:4-hydroxy-2-oxoglutarate aldolase
MGEAIHLSHAERVTLIKAARKALDDAGCLEMPIISGTGAGSTRETIELCKKAAEAGSDYAIVIASGYFSGALANNKTALKNFWVEVSQNSPIPVMIYNCVFSYLNRILHPSQSSKILLQVAASI